MNKVILMGRLTRDPETRYSQGNADSLNITRYTLAVNRKFKREGEPDADFINCTAIGKSGEFAERFLKKGMQILVTGRLQIRAYDDPKTNQRNWYTEIIIDEQNFTESKAAFESRQSSYGGQPSQDYDGYAQPPASSASQGKPANNDVPADFFIETELSDDDLPF